MVFLYSTTRWKRWQIDGLGWFAPFSLISRPHPDPPSALIVSCICSLFSLSPRRPYCILYSIIPQREGSQFPSSPLIFVLHLTQAVRLAPFPPAPAYDLIFLRTFALTCFLQDCGIFFLETLPGARWASRPNTARVMSFYFVKITNLFPFFTFMIEIVPSYVIRSDKAFFE